MSPSVDDALSQWLAQLAEMKAAIAELKSTNEISNSTPFGGDIQKELETFDVRPQKGNILDLVAREYNTYDESEEDTSSNDLTDTQNGVSSGIHDQGWLQQECQRVEKQGSELDSNQLYDQVSATLVSDSSGMGRLVLPLRGLCFIEESRVTLTNCGRRGIADDSGRCTRV